MAYAYTPGLKVTPRLRHRCRRVLPIAGEVLVKAGQRMEARDVVARTSMPGDIKPVNLANVLSIPPADVTECMLKQPGEAIEVGDLVARTKGIFGLFKSEYRAKVAGTLETVSHVTGQLIIRGAPLPVEVRAYLAGEVVEVIPEQGVVIEADVTYVQGIFGIGGEAFGPIRLVCTAADEDLTPDKITEESRGTVVAGGARMTGDAVRKAVDVGAAAVVSGGLDDQDLKEILGYDLGVAITGSEHIGVTLIVTEGFGEIAMAARTFELLASREGDPAAVNGATQIRAGVIRPEIMIPLSDLQQAREPEPVHSEGVLDIGTSVRIIRDPYFGRIGSIASLPPELRTLGSESKARVVEVTIEAGRNIVVPRANVELIET